MWKLVVLAILVISLYIFSSPEAANKVGFDLKNQAYNLFYKEKTIKVFHKAQDANIEQRRELLGE